MNRLDIIKNLQTLKVKNEKLLEEYVDFCLEHNQGKRIKFKTALHHILPKAKNLPFKSYSNLKDNVWNGVHLTHHDHYIAHSMLAESTNNYSISCAFIAMHNKNVNLKILGHDDLVDADVYDKLKQKHSKQMSCRQNELQPNGLTNAENNAIKAVKTKRESGYYETLTAEQLHTSEAIAKQHKTLNTINPKTGLTRAQEIGKKGSATKQKHIEKYSGENNHFYGKHHNEETKQKMRGKRPNFSPKTKGKKMTDIDENYVSPNKGVAKSEETKQKFRDAAARRPIRTCPHCGKKGKGSNMTRYHFDNCKCK